MEIKVEKPMTLEDGVHYGKIVDVEYRESPYNYTDMVIEEEKTGMKLKAGYPTRVMLDSKLGKLLIRFGVEVIEQAAP